MIEELTPVSILLAGIITLGLVNHQGGIMVLRAGGINTVRIITPLVLAAVIFSLATVALAEWIVPPTTERTNQILFEKVRKEKPKGIVRNDRFFYRDDRGFYSFKGRKAGQNRFGDFSYSAWDDEYSFKLLLSARTAVWNNNTWTLLEGLEKRFSGPGSYRITSFQQKEFPLKATPEDFFTPVYKINELSLSDLYTQAHKDDGQESAKAYFKLLERISLIVLGIPLLLLGLPVLMMAHQKWRRDISIAIPISCGLALAAWGGWGTMQSISKGGAVHPQLAAWAIHFLIGTLGLILILRQDH